MEVYVNKGTWAALNPQIQAEVSLRSTQVNVGEFNDTTENPPIWRKTCWSNYTGRVLIDHDRRSHFLWWTFGSRWVTAVPSRCPIHKICVSDTLFMIQGFSTTGIRMVLLRPFELWYREHRNPAPRFPFEGLEFRCIRCRCARGECRRGDHHGWPWRDRRRGRSSSSINGDWGWRFGQHLPARTRSARDAATPCTGWSWSGCSLRGVGDHFGEY